MSNKGKVLVVGLGEVGKPLLDLVSEYHEAIGVEISPIGPVRNVDVLHVCYPFQIPNFVEETVRYIETFQPALTVIESTVAIGTTRAIAERTRTPVVNSPVRGKHARMLEEMRMYTKFIGAMDAASGDHAARHFESMGLRTKLLPSPEMTELAKLSETTYFGLLIAWAQEVERYCDRTGASYDEVVSFYDEIQFFPRVKFFSGVIGGHCVMPNIELLKTYHPSVLLETIQISNDMKIERESGGRVVEQESAASVLSGGVRSTRNRD